jgi:hypothetical protein
VDSASETQSSLPPLLYPAWLVWNDPANWRRSKKGNLYIWVTERNVTIWRGPSGRWSWVIGRRKHADGQELWSRSEFDTEWRAGIADVVRRPIASAELAAALSRSPRLPM